MEFVPGYCPNCFAHNNQSGGKCQSCGYLEISQGSSLMTLRPGSLFRNRYLLGRALGMGGFGITYLALDIKASVLCAVKEYLPMQIATRNTRNNNVMPGNSDDSDTYRRGLSLFAKETEMLSGFRGNPSVVQVWDFFEDNNTAYFVMEFLDGVSLKALVRSMNGRIPLVFANDIFLNVGTALEALHKKGMLHRDVSPENIMITKSGGFKLIDFGATRYFIGEKSKSLSVVLKPGFAPPEQYSSRGVQGPWVDVYALAATFYTAVSGTRLPDAMDRLAGVTYAPLRELEPGIGKVASNAIDKALELNYKRRFQNIHSFLSAVFGGNSAPTPQTPIAKNPAPPPKPRTQSPAPPPQHQQSQSQNNSAKPFDPRHMRNNPCLLEISPNGSSKKWILPKNMDMTVGCSPKHSNIVVRIAGGADAQCSLRYDEKNGCFYLRNLLEYGLFLAGGAVLRQNQPYTLKPGDAFYILSPSNTYRVEVE